MLNYLKNIILLIALFTFVSSCGILKKTEEDVNGEELVDDRTKRFTFNNFLLEGAKRKTLGNFEDAVTNYKLAARVDDSQPVVFYEIAKILIMAGDFSTAQEYAQKAVDLDFADNEHYRKLLAGIYLNRDLKDEAKKVFKDLIDINPNNIFYYFELANLQFSAGETRSAIRTLNKAENHFGVTDHISLEKERIYRASGRNNRAVREMEKLLEEFPDVVDYKVLLAESYINNNMLDKARETYEKVDLDNVDNGLIFFSMADFFRIVEDYDKSFELLRLGFAEDDVSLDVKIQMLISMIELSGYDEYLDKNAMKLMQVLLDNYYDNIKVRTLYSDFLVFQDDYKKAQYHLNYVLDKQKDNFVIWEQALFIDHELRDYESMYKRSKEAVDYFPNQPILLLFYSLSAFQTENYEDVIDAGQRAEQTIISDEDMRVQILTFKAEAYRNLDDYEKSDKTFELILKIKPNDKLVLNNYSYYLALREENLDKALEMSTKLMKIDGVTNPTFIDTHAWVLYKKAYYEEALKYIEMAVDKDSGNAVHLEHKGDILYKLSRKEEALQYWKKALEAEEGEVTEFLEEKIKKKTLIE